MRIKSLILGLFLLIPLQAQAQFTATYGTLVTSLNTTSTGAVTGTAFAVPSSYAALIQWTVVADGSALSVNLLCSVDNVSYFVVDTQTTAAGGTKQFGFTACKFIRIDAVSRTGGSGTIGTLVTSRGFITSGSAGNLGSLNLSPGPLTITQGTLTTDINAISTTATWNNAGTTFFLWKAVVTDTASAATSKVIDIKGGAAGTTDLFYVNKFGSGFFSGNTVVLGGAYWGINGRAYWGSPGSGIITLHNENLNDFNRIQLGCTTSSCPAIKRSSAAIAFRLADDSADAAISASAITGTSYRFINLIDSSTAPTISSGFGTSPTVPANNGTATFTINIGTGGTANSGVIGLPAATTGWFVHCNNLTANTATVFITKQTATTTTTATIGNYDAAGAAAAWTASNILVCSARAY